MSVWKLRDGDLVKTNLDLDAALPEGNDFGESLEQFGFREFDGVDGAYVHWIREADAAVEDKDFLPGVRHLFDVDDGSHCGQEVILANDLPSFIAVMAMLKPLADRAYRLADELEREHQARGN